MRILSLRDQAPADKGDEHEPCGRGDRAHGGEIEHREGLAERILADRGDDDVGRRPDQRRHAAEDRREAQRHEAETRRAFRLARRLHVDRHQQGERRDIVHEGREHAADAAHDGDMRPEASVAVHEGPRDQEDRPGPHEPGRDDENQRHDQRGRVPEAREGILGRHHSQDDADHQRGKRHDIIAIPPPEQKGEDRREQREKDDLVLGQGHSSGYAQTSRSEPRAQPPCEWWGLWPISGASQIP